MKKDAVLAIDAGTSSAKVGLIDFEGNLLVSANSPYQFTTPRKDWVELDFEVLWRAVIQACNKLPLSGYKTNAVGLSVLRPTLVCMDHSGNPLRPAIIYMDRRSRSEAQHILTLAGEQDFLQHSGNLPYPGSLSVTNMLWIKKHEPGIYKDTAYFGHTNTFLIHRLTGSWAIDPSNASYTGLYDTISYGGWNRDIAHLLGISINKLPPIVNSFEAAGFLTGEAASTLNIEAGIPVVAGGGDTGVAALGAGVEEEGQILSSSGTVEVMVLCTSKPIPSKNYLIATHPLTNKWLIMNIIPTGGCALEWIRKEMYRDIEKESFYSTYLPTILNRPSSNVKAAPFFAGDRTSFTERNASFSGITIGTGRDELLHALAEGIVREMRRRYDYYLDNWFPQHTIKTTGGGADLLLPIKKKYFPKSDWVQTDNAALKGAARLALTAVFN